MCQSVSTSRAENAVYQTEKLLSENGDKVDAEKKARVESAIADLKKALEAGDGDDMKAKLEALNAVMQEVSGDLYSQASAEGGEQAQPGDAAGGPESAGAEPKEEKKEDGDVIDADFEMVDDDKK